MSDVMSTTLRPVLSPKQDCNSEANITSSELLYAVPYVAQTQFEFSISANLRTKSIYNLLVQNVYDKYEFGSNRVGSGFWNINQLDLLHQNKFITNAAQDVAVERDIVKPYPDQTPLTLDRVKEGYILPTRAK